jgi:hypothetical protein
MRVLYIHAERVEEIPSFSTTHKIKKAMVDKILL